MTGLIMTAQLILGLSILVTLHELGHFLAARAFGIKVEKFYLFFDAWGVKLFSFKRGDTEYGIGWLPLGGYVKIAGMIDESMDKEQMAKEPQDWEFRSKPAWQRLIVMVAGVTMNLILGVAIFSFSLKYFTTKYLTISEVNKTGGIYAYELGREAGLKTGDKILAINGDDFERFDELLSTRIMFGAKLSVERNHEKIEVVIPDNFYKKVTKKGRGHFIGSEFQNFKIDSVVSGFPAASSGIQKGDLIVKAGADTIIHWGDLRENIMGHAGKKLQLGIIRDNNYITLETHVDTSGTIGIASENTLQLKDYTMLNAFVFGTSDAIEALTSNAKGFAKLFTGEEKASDSLQGPIGIAKIYGGVWDWRRFWGITGLLSMVLAFMNILPIPALDGGHVIFLSIEAITRKKFSDTFMERAQIGGMVLLLALMAFAVGNDVWKNFIK
jgi:regulator of sigma E protease